MCKRKTSNSKTITVALFTFVVCMCAYFPRANSALLTDTELFFDPDTIVPDFYSRIVLSDLGMENSHTFSAGADPIVDADILPVLKAGDYYSGYSFSQNDYLESPNVDYFGDLTNGTLTTTFEKAGLYHVRVERQSGIDEIFAIFAESSLQEKAGSPDKTGANKKIEIPDADLYLIDNGDTDNANKVETILTNDSQTAQKVDSRQDAIDKIKAKSTQLGRKIHVEIAGHGASANASVGAGKSNIPSKQIDPTSVTDFQKEIDAYVNDITFYLMCDVGKGQGGQDFLQVLADSIGTAGAWDAPVTRVGTSYYTVERSANYGVVQSKEIPEPASLLLIIIGMFGLLIIKADILEQGLNGSASRGISGVR